MKLCNAYCYRITDPQKVMNNTPREYLNSQTCIAYDQYYGKVVFIKKLPDEILEDCGLIPDNVGGDEQ